MDDIRIQMSITLKDKESREINILCDDGGVTFENYHNFVFTLNVESAKKLKVLLDLWITNQYLTK